MSIYEDLRGRIAPQHRRGADVSLAYREDQVQMLREMLRDARQTIDRQRAEILMALDRAEQAEAKLRILREEIAEAKRPKPLPWMLDGDGASASP